MVKEDSKEINGSGSKVLTQNSESESPREIQKQPSISTIEGPEDKGSVVFAIFLLWGIGVLLPWNAVLSIYDYFVADMDGYSPTQTYGFANNGLLCFTQMAMTVYGHKLSNRFKIQIGFIASSLLMAGLPFTSDLLGTPGEKFGVTFGVLFVNGAVNGMVQGQVFGQAGTLPGKYMGAVMLGNGLSGIVMNSLKIFILLLLPGGDENIFKNELIFCLLAALTLILCAVGYSVLQKNEFYLYYQRQSESSKDPKTKSILEEDQATDQESIIEQHQNLVAAREQQTEMTLAQFLTQLKNNFMLAKSILLALWWVFTLTFIVFPNVFYQSFFDFVNKWDIPDTDKISWYFILQGLLFNVCDTAGRYLGGAVHLPTKVIVMLSIGRTVFALTTTLIALNEYAFFQNDTIKILNMVLFAFSNGYVSTQCAIKAPQSVREDQREQVGICVGVFLTFGILSGSIATIPFSKIVQ